MLRKKFGGPQFSISSASVSDFNLHNMKLLLLSLLASLLFACTKFETTKPTISMTRSGLNNEFVNATGNFSELPREKVLYYGVRLDSIANAPLSNAYAQVGLPCPTSYTNIFGGTLSFMVPGQTYYLRSFAALKTGELLISEQLEFIF
jgi:hypothetical protein